jgi:hypothetical protein
VTKFCSKKSVTFCQVVVAKNILFTLVVLIPEHFAQRSQIRAYGPPLFPGSTFDLASLVNMWGGKQKKCQNKIFCEKFKTIFNFLGYCHIFPNILKFKLDNFILKFFQLLENKMFTRAIKLQGKANYFCFLFQKTQHLSVFGPVQVFKNKKIIYNNRIISILNFFKKVATFFNFSNFSLKIMFYTFTYQL